MASKKRKVRCGSCNSCLAQDCQRCKFCLDKVKYGGPGLMKQCCIKRICQKRLPKRLLVKKTQIASRKFKQDKIDSTKFKTALSLGNKLYEHDMSKVCKKLGLPFNSKRCYSCFGCLQLLRKRNCKLCSVCKFASSSDRRLCLNKVCRPTYKVPVSDLQELFEFVFNDEAKNLKAKSPSRGYASQEKTEEEKRQICLKFKKRFSPFRCYGCAGCFRMLRNKKCNACSVCTTEAETHNICKLKRCSRIAKTRDVSQATKASSPKKILVKIKKVKNLSDSSTSLESTRKEREIICKQYGKKFNPSRCYKCPGCLRMLKNNECGKCKNCTKVTPKLCIFKACYHIKTAKQSVSHKVKKSSTKSNNEAMICSVKRTTSEIPSAKTKCCFCEKTFSYKGRLVAHLKICMRLHGGSSKKNNAKSRKSSLKECKVKLSKVRVNSEDQCESEKITENDSGSEKLQECTESRSDISSLEKLPKTFEGPPHVTESGETNIFDIKGKGFPEEETSLEASGTNVITEKVSPNVNLCEEKSSDVNRDKESMASESSSKSLEDISMDDDSVQAIPVSISEPCNSDVEGTTVTEDMIKGPNVVPLSSFLGDETMSSLESMPSNRHMVKLVAAKIGLLPQESSRKWIRSRNKNSHINNLKNWTIQESNDALKNEHRMSEIIEFEVVNSWLVERW